MQESTYCVCDPWMKHTTEQKVYHWHVRTITHKTHNRTKCNCHVSVTTPNIQKRGNGLRLSSLSNQVQHTTERKFVAVTYLQSRTRHTNHNSTLLTSSSPHPHPCIVFWSHQGLIWAGWMSHGQSQDTSHPLVHQRWCWLYANRHC